MNIPKQHHERIERQNANMPEPMAAVMGAPGKGKKIKPVQSSIFTAGQELPIFTQSAYGTAPAPFVEREEVKEVRLFANDWSELAQAEQKKKAKRRDEKATAVLQNYKGWE